MPKADEPEDEAEVLEALQRQIKQARSSLNQLSHQIEHMTLLREAVMAARNASTQLELERAQVLRSLAQDLEAAQAKRAIYVAGEACPQCGKPLRKLLGPYGPFLGCSGHPQCNFTHSE